MPHLRGPRASHRRHFESATSSGPRRPRCQRPGSRPARGSRLGLRARVWAAPILSPSGRGVRQDFSGRWGRARCRTGSRAPSFRPPTPQGSSSRRGPRTPSRRSRMLCSLIPVDIPTAATASTALSADSALIGLCHNPHSRQSAAFRRHQSCHRVPRRHPPRAPPGTGWASAAGRRRAGRSVPIPERTVSFFP
jgi:hypothetical protein